MTLTEYLNKMPLEWHLDQLKIKDDPKYELWNPQSIYHLCTYCFGARGDETRDLALENLRLYMEWKKNNPSEGDDSFFGNSSYKFVENAYNDVTARYKMWSEMGMTPEEMTNTWSEVITYAGIFDRFYMISPVFLEKIRPMSDEEVTIYASQLTPEIIEEMGGATIYQ
jgi:hypothetical protein